MAKKPDASKLTYSKESIREGMKRPELEDGVYPFLTSNPKSDVLPKGEYAGCLTLGVTVAALSNPEDPTSKIKPVMRDGCVLPLDNPDWPGHTAPIWAWGLTGGYLAGNFTDGEKVKVHGGTLQFWKAPEWKDGDLYFKGKKQDPVKEEECREEYGEVIANFAIALYGDPSPLKDRFYYGEVGKRKPGDRFKNILDRWEELPADRKLVDVSTAGVVKQNRRSTKKARKKKKTA